MTIINRISSICKNRNTLLLKFDNIICGQISYTKKNNTTILSNLYIDPSYRNNGFATRLLKEIETVCISDNSTKQSQINNLLLHQIKLCAWEPIDKPYLVSFYKRKGFFIDPMEYTRYYDDEDRIFVLVEMSKEIVIDPLAKN